MNLHSQFERTAPYDTADDARLFAFVQAGDERAFATLVNRYQRPMLRLALSRLDRVEWAEEALQETWLAAFRSAHTYNPRYALRTWLWTILLNQCRRQAAHRAKRKLLSADTFEETHRPEPVANVPTPLAQAIANEHRSMLARFLKRLPENESDALRLRFYGGLTFAEIAQTMDCALLTAKNRVRRGLMRLAEMRQLQRLAAETDISRNQSSGENVQNMATGSAAAIAPTTNATGDAR